MGGRGLGGAGVGGRGLGGTWGGGGAGAEPGRSWRRSFRRAPPRSAVPVLGGGVRGWADGPRAPLRARHVWGPGHVGGIGVG